MPKNITEKDLKKLIDSLKLPELAEIAVGPTGYLDQWELYPDYACWGKDKYGRLYLLTPRFIVSHISPSSNKILSHGERNCIFQRYAKENSVLVTSDKNSFSPAGDFNEAAFTAFEDLLKNGGPVVYKYGMTGKETEYTLMIPKE